MPVMRGYQLKSFSCYRLSCLQHIYRLQHKHKDHLMLIMGYVSVRFHLTQILLLMLMPPVKTRLRLKYSSVSDNGYNYTFIDAKCFVMSGFEAL